MIMQKAMIELYAPTVVTESWEHVQQAIARLCERLEAWSVSLPSGLNFNQTNASANFQRERLILQIRYIETKILITRPCLCRLDARIANQTKDSSDFNKRTARTCARTAKAMADLLPDDVDPTYLYKAGPWWSVVHNLMQALIVMLLEMSYGTVHFPEDGKEILASVKKLIRWLKAMAKNNPIAERAYTVAFGMLHRVALQFNADISDLVREDTARTNHPVASDFENQFAAGSNGHRFQSSAGEDGQTLGEQELGANSFYDSPTGHTSMFEIPATQPQDNPLMAGNYSQTYYQLDPVFGNPFATVYDEGNPDTSGRNLFDMNSITQTFGYQQPPS